MIHNGAIDVYGPYVGQALVQIAYAVMNIVIKLALEDGLDHYVFVTYRQLVATVAISPIAYFAERNNRPPLTLKVAIHIFLLGLLGITINQNLYFSGLSYTSATFASATTNLIPVMTFILALLLRMEHVEMRKIRGLAKVAGTAICVGGAMIMTIYRGSKIGLVQYFPRYGLSQSNLDESSWVLGAVLLFTSALAWSIWLTYQAWVIPCYPAQLPLTALMCFMATFQSCALTLLVDRDTSKWKLGWNIQLVSYIYTGLTCSAFAVFVQSWCIKKKGPVFSSAFNPFATVLVAILQTVWLREYLHMGSVVGGIFVILGLYFVLWGKAADRENKPTLGTNLATNGAVHDEEAIVDAKEPLLNGNS